MHHEMKLELKRVVHRQRILWFVSTPLTKGGSAWAVGGIGTRAMALSDLMHLLETKGVPEFIGEAAPELPWA